MTRMEDHRGLSASLLHDATFRRLCRARDLLAAEYQSKLSLEKAGREACLSPFHFHRLFTAAFAETPHEFITHRRLDLAKRLLAAGEMSVTVARLVKKGVFGAGVFDTADCRKTYEELKAKGVEFLSPPKEELFGIQAVFKDPFGNWFSMTQPKNM